MLGSDLLEKDLPLCLHPNVLKLYVHIPWCHGYDLISLETESTLGAGWILHQYSIHHLKQLRQEQKALNNLIELVRHRDPTYILYTIVVC